MHGLLLSLLAASSAAAGQEAAPKRPAPHRPSSSRKIVLLAGGGSHGFGCHAYYAGCMLLAKPLNELAPGVRAVVSRGWPKDPKVIADADALVIACDGGAHSLIRRHVSEVEKLMKRGAGMAVLHYATLAPKGPRGEQMLDWIGGYYETHWSVNPIWVAHFKQLPDHPITRGVRPFRIRDEWYYHMRFREDMAGVTPILTAVPPDGTRKRPDGPHSGNPHVRARMGMPEHVAWACERRGGGRGFGFTGAHWHWNWAHDDYRKLVLNALVWVAGAEVPPNGVPSTTPTVEELEANQASKRPANVPRQAIQDLIDELKRPPAK